VDGAMRAASIRDQAGTRERGHLIALALVVLLAIGLRVAWVVYVNVDPEDGRFDDSLFYHGFARSMANGDGYVDPLGGQPSANWPPAYSALLAVFYLPFGSDVTVAKVVNIALAAAAVLLTYGLASRLFDRRVGLMGALAIALLPSHLYFSTMTMAENLFVPLLLLVVLLLAIWGLDRQPTALQSIGLGTAIALAALTRTEGIWLLLPALVLWCIASRGWLLRARNCALIIVTVVVVLTPWTVRNAIEFHEFIPLRQASQSTFAIGLNPDYDYYGVAILFHPLDPRAIPPDQYPTLSEDMEAWRDEPWTPFDLARRKLVNLFDNDHDVLDWINNSPSHPYLSSSEYKLWRSVANAAYYALGAVAVIGLGLALLARDRRAMLLGSVPLTWILGFWLLVPESRYHLALLPIAAVCAAALAATLASRASLAGWQAWRSARPIAAVALIAALGVAAAGAATNATIDHDVQEANVFLSALGETVTLGDLEITAHAVTKEPTHAEFGDPPTGQAWVIVDLELRNTGSDAILLLGPAQAVVEDGLRNTYQLQEPAGGGPLSSEIAANQTVRTPVVFDVPDDATGLQFVFRAVGIASVGRWELE
jgi:4-amino-4-deoxy-L-arabinose transferase-like glycosyltransferase